MKEKHYRSIVKGISYRILGTITTMIISFVLTGSTATALSIGLADVLVKVSIYYLHERIWNRIPLGKHPPSSSDYQI